MVGPLEVLARLRKHYGVQGWWPVDRAYHEAHGTDARFEIILGAFLTQNTTWASAERALANLKERDLFDPVRLARAPATVVREAVRPAGFYNQKASCVQNFARYVATTHGGRLDEMLGLPVAKLRPLLLSFQGIGEETADDILVYAARRPSFIVDAYTRRLTHRLGLGTGEEPYAELQRLWGARLGTDAKAHAEAHALLVEHAKARCTARAPRCPGCPLEGVCAQRDVEADVYDRFAPG